MYLNASVAYPTRTVHHTLTPTGARCTTASFQKFNLKKWVLPLNLLFVRI